MMKLISSRMSEQTAVQIKKTFVQIKHANQMWEDSLGEEEEPFASCAQWW